MKKLILAAAAFGLLAPRAWAVHPLVGEDTVFLAEDVKEAELGFLHAVEGDGPGVTSNAGTARLAYGLLGMADIILGASWHGWTSRGISQSGLGDVSLETKFKVAERAGWTYALKPGFSLPAGDESKSLGAGKGGVWLYGVAGRRAGPWEFYLNAGYTLNRNTLNEREDLANFSAAAQLEAARGLKVTGALAAGTNKDKSSQTMPASSTVGLVWSAYPTLDLSGGFRLGLTGPAEDTAVLLGLTLRM